MSDAIKDRTAALGRTCRHFNGRLFLMGEGDGRDACAQGYPIRKIVIGACGGDNSGIVFKTPCRPGPEKKADCPHYDPETDDEVAAKKAANRKMMENAMKLLQVAHVWKAEMIAEKQTTAVKDCPCCGREETVHVSIALGYNNHMACQCSVCNAGFRE